MKKRFPILLGISVITGVVSSLVVRHKKQPITNYYHDYVGTWRYQKNNRQPEVVVSVTPEYQLLFQDRPEPIAIVELSPHRLVFLDKMGYHIIFEKKGDKLTFYDETDGTSYLLTPITAE